MNLHEIRMAGIRAAEDAVVRDLEKSGLAALTGAQPAPAAPSDTDAEHAAWLADKIVAHGDYAKEAAAMLRRWPACSAAPAAPSADRAAQWLVEVRDQFRGIAEQANQALTRHVADLAQPADSAMEVLRELVAIKDLQRSRAQAEAHAAKFQTPENYAVVDKLWSEIARRTEPAWDRARTLNAASNKERQHG